MNILTIINENVIPISFSCSIFYSINVSIKEAYLIFRPFFVVLFMQSWSEHIKMVIYHFFITPMSFDPFSLSVDLL